MTALDRQSGGPDGNAAQGGHLVTVATFDAEFSNQAAVTTDGTAGMLTRKLQKTTHTPQGVRRLTPTECERLMGWPDGHTLPGPDSRRYAACGDGVVAHVAEWIGRRLLAETRGVLDREVAA